MSEVCANPQLLSWVHDMYLDARERNLKSAPNYRKAYEALKACPLVFNHPSEALELKGFGTKICDHLTQKLEQHCKDNGLPMPQRSTGRKRSSTANMHGDVVQDENGLPAKKPRRTKPYMPKYRSGGYALIIALSSLRRDSLQGLTKIELVDRAQPHCDSSFTMPTEAGRFYTAWNSMNTLVDNGLVHERGRPARLYTLTDDGWELAEKFEKVHRSRSGIQGEQEASISAPHGPLLDSIECMSEVPNAYMDGQGEVDQAISRCAVPQRAAGQPTAPVLRHEVGREDQAGIQRIKKKSSRLPPENDILCLSSSPKTGRNRDSRPPARQGSVPLVKPANGNAVGTGILANAITHTGASCDISYVDPLVIEPGTFSIRLILDNREVHSKDRRGILQQELIKLGVEPLQRSLELGDFFWVAKLHDSSLLRRLGEDTDEIALDWIVERKRLDDLVGSIKDGRFKEQRFRLQKSGTKNVIYLIEHFTLDEETKRRFHDAIQTSTADSQVINDFFVKQSEGTDDSLRYIASLTNMLKTLYESKPLRVIPTRSVTAENYLPLLKHLSEKSPSESYNITYPTFANLSSKSDTLTLRDVFIKMLMCTRGISGEKALAMQKCWSTPRHLIEAYEKCATAKENEKLAESKTADLFGRSKIKTVMSKKVASIWGA